MEELCTQRYELEIQNATDIIYVLCMERLRNNARMQAVHKYFNVNIYISFIIYFQSCAKIYIIQIS